MARCYQQEDDTLREGQQIRIGEDIVITLVEMRGGQARIGVDAPPEMTVFRVDPEAERMLAEREEKDDAL